MAIGHRTYSLQMNINIVFCAIGYKENIIKIQ